MIKKDLLRIYNGLGKTRYFGSKLKKPKSLSWNPLDLAKRRCRNRILIRKRNRIMLLFNIPHINNTELTTEIIRKKRLKNRLTNGIIMFKSPLNHIRPIWNIIQFI